MIIIVIASERKIVRNNTYIQNAKYFILFGKTITFDSTEFRIQKEERKTPKILFYDMQYIMKNLCA